jgi:putative flippase GtrA
MSTGNPFKSLAARLATAWHERAVLLKAISFGLVGVVNTAIDFLVFWTAYQALGLLPLVPANVLSWFVAVSGSYVMNSFTTFAAESGRQLTMRGYATFVGSGIAGVIANTATLVVAAMFMHVLLAKLLAIGVSFLVNFSLSHFVVFRPRRREAGGARIP